MQKLNEWIACVSFIIVSIVLSWRTVMAIWEERLAVTLVLTSLTELLTATTLTFRGQAWIMSVWLFLFSGTLGTELALSTSLPAIVLSGVDLCSSPLSSCRLTLTLTHDQISDITRPVLPNSVILSHSWKPCSNGISSKYYLPSLTGIVGSLIFYIFLFIISH